MATWAEALLVSCDECDALKGDPCTYIVDTEKRARGQYARDAFGGWYWQPGPIIEMHKIGEPTSRPHNQRFNRADAKFHRRRPPPRPVHPPSERRLAIARAENQFDRVEQNRVFWWLQAYGSILINEESDVKT